MEEREEGLILIHSVLLLCSQVEFIPRLIELSGVYASPAWTGCLECGPERRTLFLSACLPALFHEA